MRLFGNNKDLKSRCCWEWKILATFRDFVEKEFSSIPTLQNLDSIGLSQFLNLDSEDLERK